MQKQAAPTGSSPVAPARVPHERNADDQAVLDVTDDVLDEIDELLEANAEEFLAGYQQKGGQ